jgi:hypothetical protein
MQIIKIIIHKYYNIINANYKNSLYTNIINANYKNSLYTNIINANYKIFIH